MTVLSAPGVRAGARGHSQRAPRFLYPNLSTQHRADDIGATQTRAEQNYRKFKSSEFREHQGKDNARLKKDKMFRRLHKGKQRAPVRVPGGWVPHSCPSGPRQGRATSAGGPPRAGGATSLRTGTTKSDCTQWGLKWAQKVCVRKTFQKQSIDDNLKDTVKRFQTEAPRHRHTASRSVRAPRHEARGEEPWARPTALRAASSPAKRHHVICLTSALVKANLLHKSLTSCPSTEKARSPESLPPTSGLQETGCRHPTRSGERSPRPLPWAQPGSCQYDSWSCVRIFLPQNESHSKCLKIKTLLSHFFEVGDQTAGLFHLLSRHTVCHSTETTIFPN